MHNVFLIGLSGKMGSGKTTITNFLIKLFNEDSDFMVYRIGLGDCLKSQVAAKYGIALEDCYSQEGKEKIYRFDDIVYHVSHNLKGSQDYMPLEILIDPRWFFERNGIPGYHIKVREILQWYGTEVTRDRYPDYWIEALEQKCFDPSSFIKSVSTVYIVDDLRFKNELDFINKKNMNLSVRIEVYNDWIPGTHATHKSETDLDDCLDKFDLILKPNYGLESLQEQANKIFNTFLLKHINQIL